MPDKKRAQKVSHKAERRIEEPSIRFEEFLNGRLGDKRLVNRILDGRKVKPCGRECREFGLLIAQNLNHGSFQNFTELMNDEEFILEIARMTPNPTECDNYFYQYVNPYLRSNQEFRLKFLKAVYLNDSVYKLADIKLIVEWCGLEEENEMLLQDVSFKRELEHRLEELDNQECLEYHCSGEDEKELHDYKVNNNEHKVMRENMKKGLNEIISTFVKTENNKQVEEPKDFWAYLCVQTFNQ